MKAARMIMPLLMVVVLAACQPSWVRIDGGSVDSDRLQQARITCQVDEKLAALEEARYANSVEATKASSNAGKMLQLDKFETENYVIYLEINDCMRDQGFTKP
jgi:hypothetical protein